MKEAFELMRPSKDVIKVGVSDRKRFSLRDTLGTILKVSLRYLRTHLL